MTGKLRWFAMEWVEGETLQDRLRDRDGGLKIGETTTIMRQLVDGLGGLHRNGVIHRDLKPGNVFIRRDNGVKIGDFGLSRAVGSGSRSALTRSGAVLGTERYMSPEQASGRELTEASDLYSLGLIWQEMLTGCNTGGMLRIHREYCPEAWREVIAKMLRIDPARGHPLPGAPSHIGPGRLAPFDIWCERDR